MQSTGHSSTQALSLTSTHGCAITYVMRSTAFLQVTRSLWRALRSSHRFPGSGPTIVNFGPRAYDPDHVRRPRPRRPGRRSVRQPDVGSAGSRPRGWRAVAGSVSDAGFVSVAELVSVVGPVSSWRSRGAGPGRRSLSTAARNRRLLPRAAARAHGSRIRE